MYWVFFCFVLFIEKKKKNNKTKFLSVPQHLCQGPLFCCKIQDVHMHTDMQNWAYGLWVAKINCTRRFKCYSQSNTSQVHWASKNYFFQMLTNFSWRFNWAMRVQPKTSQKMFLPVPADSPALQPEQTQSLPRTRWSPAWQPVKWLRPPIRGSSSAGLGWKCPTTAAPRFLIGPLLLCRAY